MESAPKIPPATAKPLAPSSSGRPQFSGVSPPMATLGMGAAFKISRYVSSLIGSASGLVEVACQAELLS